MLGSDTSSQYKPGQPFSGFGSQQAFQQAGSPKGAPKKPVLMAPQPQSPPPQTSGAYGKTPKPPSIDINTTEDAVNNVMAQGFQQADQRYQMKTMDRAGVSRGAGQQFIAGQESAQAMNKAAEGAAQVRMQDQQANAKMKSDYERANAQTAQASQMARHARDQADWSQKFAQQSASAQLQMAMQQAQLQFMMSLMNG